MSGIVVLFAALLAGIGLLGVVSPQRLVALVRSWQSPAGLYVVAALRIAFGVALYLAAPESRAPDLLRILGVVIVVVGIATAFFGLRRFVALLDWWEALGPGFLRAWAALALGAGLLLAYAVVV